MLFRSWAYMDRLEAWIKENFTTNREGDVTVHTRHMATGIFSLDNCSQEYVDAMQLTEYANLIPGNWREKPNGIKAMLAEMQKYDRIRDESFQQTFPLLDKYYARFL